MLVIFVYSIIHWLVNSQSLGNINFFCSDKFHAVMEL